MSITKQIGSTISTIRQAVETETPIQLSEWMREAPNEMRAVLIRFIEGTLEYFSFKKTDMSAGQIMTIVNDIIEKYYYFRLEDICLCFKKGRQDSSYRKFYGRVDGSVFLDWFAKYDKEREGVLDSHPSNYRATVDLSNGVPWEDYEAEMKKRMEAGDEKAKEQYEAMLHVKQMFERNAGVYSNYQYNRKHRFDDKK